MMEEAALAGSAGVLIRGKSRVFMEAVGRRESVQGTWSSEFVDDLI